MHQNLQDLNSFCSPRLKPRLSGPVFQHSEKGDTPTPPPGSVFAMIATVLAGYRLPSYSSKTCLHHTTTHPQAFVCLLSPMNHILDFRNIYHQSQCAFLDKLNELPFFKRKKKKKVYFKTLTASSGCNKPMLKGSTDFNTSHGKPDNEEMKKASKAPSDIFIPQAQFPKALRKAEIAKGWQRKQ